MNLINEKVEHVSYGLGIVIKEEDNKISVQFNESIGDKTFLYPEAFEKFLKAAKPEVESTILEELHAKQKKLELERLERAREASELEEQILKLNSAKKRVSRAVRHKA